MMALGSPDLLWTGIAALVIFGSIIFRLIGRD